MERNNTSILHKLKIYIIQLIIHIRVIFTRKSTLISDGLDILIAYLSTCLTYLDMCTERKLNPQYGTYINFNNKQVVGNSYIKFYISGNALVEHRDNNNDIIAYTSPKRFQDMSSTIYDYLYSLVKLNNKDILMIKNHYKDDKNVSVDVDMLGDYLYLSVIDNNKDYKFTLHMKLPVKPFQI